MAIEQVLYGTKIGEPDYMEDIISIYPSEFKKATEWANQNGYDRLRISTIDLSVKPDFTKAIRK